MKFINIPITNVKRHFTNIGNDPATFVACEGQSSVYDGIDYPSVYQTCADATLGLLNEVYGITLEVNHGGVSSLPPPTPLEIINMPEKKWHSALAMMKKRYVAKYGLLAFQKVDEERRDLRSSYN